MLRVGSEYNAQLQLMVNRVRKSIQAELVPAIYAEEKNYTADAWPETIQVIIERLLRQYDNPLFEALARRLATQFVNSSLSFADRQNRRSFGIEVFNGSSTKLNNYMQAAITQNVNLIKSIPQRYLEDVGNTVQTGMRNGVLPRYIAKSIEENHGVSSRRAKFIARDQAAKVNGEISKQRQIDSGFTYFKWVDSHDERVRHRHRDIAKADNGMGEGVYSWSDLPLSSEGTPIQPGSDYNCFPGHLPLNIFAGAKRAFRHRYNGELTELVTDSGEVFCSTAKHPVLTDRGYVAAELINVGDNIIQIPKQTMHIGKRDAEGSDIQFAKFFEACKLIGILGESSRALGGEFHGDITVNENIDVVAFDWSLPHGFNAESSELMMQFLLSGADELGIFSVAPRDGDLVAVLGGLTLAPDSVVRRLGQLLTFIGAGLPHAGEHPLATIGLLYSIFVKDAGNDIARGVEFFGNCFDTELSIDHRLDLFKRYVLLIGRYSFGIGDLNVPSAESLAKIVCVDSKDSSGVLKEVSLSKKSQRIVAKSVSNFSGHVYNLEMENGLFVSQGVAVSNCRCIARPMRTSVVEKTINERKSRKS